MQWFPDRHDARLDLSKACQVEHEHQKPATIHIDMLNRRCKNRCPNVKEAEVFKLWIEIVSLTGTSALRKSHSLVFFAKKTCSDEQALIWESIFLGVFFGDCLSCLLQWLQKKKESVTGDPFAGWRGL